MGTSSRSTRPSSPHIKRLNEEGAQSCVVLGACHVWSSAAVDIPRTARDHLAGGAVPNEQRRRLSRRLPPSRLGCPHRRQAVTSTETEAPKDTKLQI